MKEQAKESVADDEIIDKEYVHRIIKKVVSKLNIPKEEKLQQAKLLARVFEKGMTPREALEISNEDVAMMYQAAFYYFESGKYSEAREIFKFLTMLEPLESGFATALGTCYHRMKDYENAIRSYMLGAVLEPKDPVPLFYCYDCYVSLKDPVSAGVMLCNVIARAGDQPQYAKIKEKANLLMPAIEKEIAALDTVKQE